MTLINNLPVNDLTIRQIAERVGIKQGTIELNLTSKLLQIDGQGDCLGSCLDRGNRFIVNICNNELHGKKDGNFYHTLVHELVHVYQFQNGLELDCEIADKIAMELMGG